MVAVVLADHGLMARDVVDAPTSRLNGVIRFRYLRVGSDLRLSVKWEYIYLSSRRLRHFTG